MLLKFLPKNHLSFVAGTLARLKVPVLSKYFVRWFIKRYRVDTSNIVKPVAEYDCLADFFVRELRPGSRPIGSGLVSPADGTLRGFGPVHNGTVEQIKGKSYKLRDLLGGEEMAGRFSGGTYFNLYLSPRDYHHVHSPVSGEISALTYIPGKLWPVNDWTVSRIQDLFAVNERMVIYIKSTAGLVAVVMVGATNVGKITLAFDNLCANSLKRVCKIGRPESVVKDFNTPIAIKAGERLGTFHLGSTVVVLCEGGKLRSRVAAADGKSQGVLYGATLAELE